MGNFFIWLGRIVGLMASKQKPEPVAAPAPVMKDKLSSERVDQLHPKVRDTFRQFIIDAEQSLNITLRVVQGLRSFETQQALFDQPRDGKDNDGDGRIDEADEKVTNARPGASFHQYGLAVDVVQMLNGKAVWNQTPYKEIAKVAGKYGITWGGNWNDQPHFQKPLGHTWRTLLQMYRDGKFIPGTRYVNI